MAKGVKKSNQDHDDYVKFLESMEGKHEALVPDTEQLWTAGRMGSCHTFQHEEA